MAKGIGPLLLLGGAAAVLLMTKSKKEGPDSVPGMKLNGDCESISITDLGDAWEHLTGKMSEVFASEGIDPNTSLKDLDLDQLEGLLETTFSKTFPQCQWPPENPDSFMIGQRSWNEMVDQMRQALGGSIEARTVSQELLPSRRSGPQTATVAEIILG